MYLFVQKSCKIRAKGVIYLFEVKKEEHINKTFRMPVELVRRLEVLAQEKQVSLNNLIIQCCEYALDNLDSSKK